MIRARNVDPASPLRYQVYSALVSSTTAITNALALDVWPFAMRSPIGIGSLPSSAKIVDVIVAQSYVGAGGTSQTVTVLKNGTTIFTTAPVVALAGGVAALDTLKEIATVPTGWTRGVLKTDATVQLAKGDILSITTTVSGGYGTAPSIVVSVVIDPRYC
jgi:hypothetical protein